MYKLAKEQRVNKETLLKDDKEEKNMSESNEEETDVRSVKLVNGLVLFDYCLVCLIVAGVQEYSDPSNQLLNRNSGIRK